MQNKQETSVTVSQLNNYINRLLKSQSRLQGVRVAGEISDAVLAGSGHFYFSLKDDNSKVPGIMYRGQYSSLGFKPENGDAVVVTANATMYERDGKFQLQALNMEPQGKGDLFKLYEQLKKKLAEEGLFDSRHKQAIPTMPKVIGVATSRSGAVIRDIINVSKRRFPMAKIVLSPCSVQGAGASDTIVNSIEQLNSHPEVDVIIVGRGGGSLEDLWPFNEENVARAVFASKKPIISAVGHESDVSICDFVADLRAPTPSAAAELALPDQYKIREDLQEKSLRLRRSLKSRLDFVQLKLGNNEVTIKQAIRNKLNDSGHRLDKLVNNRYLTNPYETIEIRRQTLDGQTSRFTHYVNSILSSSGQSLAQLTASLDALSPLKVLSRGYAMVTPEDDEIPLVSVDDIDVDDKLNLYMQDGIATVNVIGKTKTEEEI